MEDGSFSSPTQAPHTDKKFLLLLGGACVLVLFFIVLAIFSFSPKQEKKPVTTVPTPQPDKPISNVYKIEPGKTKLLQTEYAPYAYKIFPGDLSLDNQTKLKHFKFTKTLNPDGSTKITVNILVSGYSPFSITAPSGTQAYFVVKDPDGDFSEDFLVLTDQNGNIIEH